ncbi:TPA: hypothetical protein ACGF9M_003316 [Vibrio cholerae]
MNNTKYTIPSIDKAMSLKGIISPLSVIKPILSDFLLAYRLQITWSW